MKDSQEMCKVDDLKTFTRMINEPAAVKALKKKHGAIKSNLDFITDRLM